MKILGINHDMFITSAAIIEDGKVIAAIAEERLTREKRSRKFPINSINYFGDSHWNERVNTVYFASID